MKDAADLYMAGVVFDCFLFCLMSEGGGFGRQLQLLHQGRKEENNDRHMYTITYIQLTDNEQTYIDRYIHNNVTIQSNRLSRIL